MDFSNLKFNCSQLGRVMSEPKQGITDKMFQRLEYLKSRPDPTPPQKLEMIELQFRFDNYDPNVLSGTCSSYLMFLYAYKRYGGGFKLKGGTGGIAQFVKGASGERSSAELIERVTGEKLYRYKSSVSDSYLKGRMDIINAKEIKDATKIIDVKTSFRPVDFMKQVNTEELSRTDSFQMQGYLSITGKDYGEVYHCLGDFSEDKIEEQKMLLAEELCPDGILTDEFFEEWAILESSMRFGHIPDEERVVLHKVYKDEKIIAKIYEKVEFCREWLAKFHEKHKNRISTQKLLWQKLSS